VVGLLYFFYVRQFSALLATFLVIEPCAALATNLIVMVRKHGGDTQQISSQMLIMYFIPIAFMGHFLAIYFLIGGQTLFFSKQEF
jgi:hypothetical protein